ncbi:MAG: SDR family oxidoreductase [Bacteroidota bacterium]
MAHNLLQGKRGIIFGALDERSIAWATALKCHEEGATFTLTNAPVAMRMGKIQELAEQCGGAEVIPADATSIDDLNNLFTKSMDILGGKIDFVLHSIGMSPNVRKNRDYNNLNYDWFLKTLDISAVSFHKVMQVADKLDAINEWGSIMALSYIAAQRTFPDYSDMAQAKALLESIARSYGYFWAKKAKVRVNTISQSPTMTTAGTGVGGFDVFFDYADKMSPLGNASADSCADYIAMMFSDYTRMVTMQNLMHDGGFSTSGITDDLVDKLSAE